MKIISFCNLFPGLNKIYNVVTSLRLQEYGTKIVKNIMTEDEENNNYMHKRDDQPLYDLKKIRPVPGFPNMWMTRNGQVYDSRLGNLHGVSVEGMVMLKVDYVDHVSMSRPVLVYADELYRKVWKREAPKDTWVPGEDIKMNVRDALNVDLIKALEIYQPEYNVGAKKLKEINEKLVKFLNAEGYDIKEILK